MEVDEGRALGGLDLRFVMTRSQSFSYINGTKGIICETVRGGEMVSTRNYMAIYMRPKPVIGILGAGVELSQEEDKLIRELGQVD